MLGGWGQPEIVRKAKMGGNGVGWWQGGDVNHLWIRWGLKMEEVGPQG
jgi:hypothetical protein